MAERGNVQVIRAVRTITVLVLVVFVAHGGAVRNGFLYDDYHLIAENPAVNGHAWRLIWTSADAASRDAQGRGFRPVTLSSYVIDHAVGGGRPALFHVSQVALHAAVVGLLYLVATGLGLASRWAAAAALLMGLHPMHIEAAQYLSARSSVLSTLGLLAAFWTYLGWRRRPTGGGWWRMASLTFVALAVWSKESAVAGLVGFVAYERLVGGETWGGAARRLALHAATFAAASVPATLAFSGAAPASSVSTETALATGVSIIGRSLWGWIVPTAVEPAFPQPWVEWNQPGAWGFAALIAVVCLGGYAVRRRLPLATWGVTAGLGGLLPVMALPFVTNAALFQPHRAYQTGAGLAIAVAALAEGAEQRVSAVVRRAWRRRLVHRSAWIVGGALAAVGVVTDVRAGRVWRSDVAFWTAAVNRYPREAAYYQSLGAARLRSGDPSRAVEALAVAARLDPLLPRVDFNLGLVYTKMGRYDQATAAYERAVEHDPSDVKALVNLGGLYERGGASDRAARAYRAALAVEPRLSAVRERLVRLEAANRSIDSGPGTSSSEP